MRKTYDEMIVDFFVDIEPSSADLNKAIARFDAAEKRFYDEVERLRSEDTHEKQL